MFIYKITNLVNNKVYIGQTNRKTVEKRWNDHKSALNRNGHGNKHLQSAWNKYGSDSFKFEILEQFQPDMNFDIDNLERYWIKTLDSQNPIKGYNKTGGGEGGKPTEETRAKMSAAKKGKPRSEETRAKMSLAQKSKVLSLESRAKMSAAGRGRKMSKLTLEALNKSKEKAIKDSNGNIYKSTQEASLKLGIKRETIKENLRKLNSRTRSGLSFTFLTKEV